MYYHIVKQKRQLPQRTYLQLKNQSTQERQEKWKAAEAEENTGETGRSQMMGMLNGKAGVTWTKWYFRKMKQYKWKERGKA